jgi:hypothetical protein
MSDAHKGLHVGENNIMFGKNHSDETRKKISGATSGENNPSVSPRRVCASEVSTPLGWRLFIFFLDFF